MHNQIQNLAVPSVLELAKIELHAKSGHMGPYSAQFVELIALIHKQEAALSTARADALAELHPAWVAAHDRADRAEAALRAQASVIDLQSIEQYRVQMAGISTAALGYWTEDESIMPEYDTPALRDVAKLYAKYAKLHAQAAPVAALPEGWVIERLDDTKIKVSMEGDASAIVRERDFSTNVQAYVLYGLASDLLVAHPQQSAAVPAEQAQP